MVRTSRSIAEWSQSSARPCSISTSSPTAWLSARDTTRLGRRFDLWLLRLRRGVGDARVVDPCEQGHERRLDLRQVPQRQVAVVELALLQALTNDPLDQLLDGFAGMVAA